MAVEEVLRAYRFALDPTGAQIADLARHAGAARWAFNHALGEKVAAHQLWRERITQLTEAGMDEAEARRTTKVPIPNKPTIQKHLNAIKGDSRTTPAPEGWHGPERPVPWWHEVSTYAFQSAFLDADMAWKNWLASLKGQRRGRPVGYPRFKRKGRARDAFRLHHDVTEPTIRTDGYRRIILPRLGSIRLHDSCKPLARLIGKGEAVVQSVTVSRGGHRWYASVLVKVQQDLPAKANRAQCARGSVAMEWGVRRLATLTKPLDPDYDTSVFVPNPRHLDQDLERIKKAQRKLSKTVKGSNRRTKQARRVGRLHHRVAERRAGATHQLTKALATRFNEIAIRELDIAGMVERPDQIVEGDAPRPVQALLHRGILDSNPGEIRRQLAYKTRWYGSTLALCAGNEPTTRACSACGEVKPKLSPAVRVYRCTSCGLVVDREINSARNIARSAIPVTDGDVNARRGTATGPARDSAGEAGRPP